MFKWGYNLSRLKINDTELTDVLARIPMALDKQISFNFSENELEGLKTDFRQHWFISVLYVNRTNSLPVNNLITTNSKFWEVKFWLLLVTYWSLDFVGRFRYKIVKSLFHVIFFENTIAMKKLFFFWIKLMPLKVHKRLIITLMENMIFIQFFNYLFFVQFKILFYIKGKLGLQGDSKKRKEIYAFRPEFKCNTGAGLSYDGVGSASRFGLTFLRIGYAQTNFTELKSYDYIPE